MITQASDFFAKGCGRCARFETDACSARVWRDGLAELRRICRELGLEETAKWGHPCYVHAGRNIAVLGAFRGDFRLNFMNPSLLSDSHGVLEKAGPSTRVAGMIRFETAADVQKLEAVIEAYLRELMGHAEAGTVPPKQVQEIVLPEELIEALDMDAELAEAFHALTPGRQRSYVINLNSAKQAATRVARIAKFRPKILAGKGATER